MKVEKKELEKSQIELTVEIPFADFSPYIERGAEKISQELKIDGFRPGKAPLEVVKAKVGEMMILEEAANLIINKTIDSALDEEVRGKAVGQPRVEIVKLAPGNPLVYKIIFAVLPAIVLGEYKNLKIKSKKEEVKDEEVEKIIEELRESRARETISDQAIRKGDKAIVDINIFLDKVPIEGGQGKDAVILVGKDYIIPGFDKELLGLKKGEEKEFKLLYPAEYHMANLAGKNAEFKIKVKEVYARELPAMDNTLAEVFGLKKAEELKENIKKSLAEEKKQKEEQKLEMEIFNKIIEKTKFGDLAEILIDNETKTMIAELEQSIVSRGGKLDDYLLSLKKTRSQLLLDMAPEAVKRVKSSLIIREIARLEKIEISDEEVLKKIEDLSERYKGYEKVEARIKEPAYKDYLRSLLVNRKVIEALREWNVLD